MMRPLASFRFIKRRVGDEIRHILQQEWIDDDPPDEGAIRYTWRDIPTVDEQEIAK